MRSRNFLRPQPHRPYLQFLRIQAEGIELAVGFVKLAAEKFLEPLPFLLKLADTLYPAFQNSGTLRTVVDEVRGAFLVLLRFAAHERVKLGGHFLALLIVVRNVKTVHHKRLVTAVSLVQCFKKVLKKV